MGMKVFGLAVFGIVAAALSVGALFWITSQDVQGTDYTRMSAPDAYQRLCAQCHGLDGRNPNGSGKSYAGLRKYWDVDRLVEYMTSPQAYNQKYEERRGRKYLYMPPIPGRVPEETRRRIAEYVLNTLMD